MLPFKTLLTVNKKNSTPVYLQIANGLVNLIREGIIKPGTALPGSREMAALLKVHRQTVVAAYEELFAQDWVETIPRKGVMVAQHLPDIKARSLKTTTHIPAYAGNAGFAFDKIPGPPLPAMNAEGYRLFINDGFPDSRLAPVELLMREYKSLFNNPAMKRMVMYGSPAGSPNLRTEMVRFLSDTRGLNINVGNVMMTHGAQMAIFIAARMILKPGSTVITGESNYFLATTIFQQFGAKVIRVSVDENGLDVDEIAKVCKKKRPDLLYVIPHHHHPTTVTMSAERRMKLLELIREYKLPVIEDDYDFDFHYNSSPVLPLASSDHGGRVIYIGSLTKSLSTSIRIGYLVATEDFVREAILFRRMMDMRGDNLMEEALAVLFKNGDMVRHLKKSVKLYHERRDLFCGLLEKELGGLVSFRKPSGGMAVWARFDARHPLPAISAKAAAKGLFISDGNSYNYGTDSQNALRLGFASLNEKEMKEVVGILKSVMK
ncbi:MAG: PLP-dependent aminotransferase family protein [Chitinophagaceae bacterium]